MNEIGSRIAELVNALMSVIALIVTPDWSALIGLLPFFIVPIVALWFFGTGAVWSLVAITKPPASLRPVDATPHPAERDAAGLPIYPAGRPYDPRAGLIYPVGTPRSLSGEPLQMGCPGCGAVRLAELLGAPVAFAGDCVGPEAEAAAAQHHAARRLAGGGKECDSQDQCDGTGHNENQSNVGFQNAPVRMVSARACCDCRSLVRQSLAAFKTCG